MRVSIRVITLSVSLLVGLCGVNLGSAQVPSVYQDLYTQLSGDIKDFQAAITNQWDGSKYAVVFSGQLTAANANNGPSLLQSLTLIQTQIQQLKTLGVKAISVEMSFPMLYQPFFDSIGHPEYQAQFITLYSNVVSAIRMQGLQVIVESQSLIPNGLQSVWGTGVQDFYASLPNFASYIAARSNTVGVVARTMQPDFFVLQEEPDTEANQSGQSQAGTAAGSTMMLSGSLAAARSANVPGMKVGAGFGSWLQAFQLFANSFTQQHCGEIVNGQPQPCLNQPLDFLDLHLYPITEQTLNCAPPPNPAPCTASNFWQNALNILTTANATGMPMTVSQTWLRKVRDSEWPKGVSGDVQEAREAYSFWAPLDASFLQTVYDLANYAHMLFVVPFNTQNDYAYLTWDATTALQGEGGTNAPAQIFREVQTLALANAPAGIYTDTGVGYNELILQRPRFTGLQFEANGSFQLTLSGSPNVNYVISATLELNHGWTNVATLSSSNGIINYDDPPPISASKYYRAMIAP